MNLFNKTVSLFAVFTIVFLISPQTVWAQSEAIEPAPAVEEILVTARKRVESIQQVPVAMEVFSMERLDRQDLVNLPDIAAVSPNLSIGRSLNGAGAVMYMRGIGSTWISVGAAPSTAVIVDNIYFGWGRMINEGFFDTEQVEILRGPQALVFGKNATAGAITLTTANPTDEFEVLLRGGYEFNAEEPIFQGVISGPLSDTFGARFAFRASKQNGGLFSQEGVDVDYTFTDIATGNTVTDTAPAAAKDTPGLEEYFGRLTLKWDPTDRLGVLLKVSSTYQDNDDGGYNYMPYRCPANNEFSQLNPALPCSKTDFVNYHNAMPQVVIDSGMPYAKAGGLYHEYRSYSISPIIEYEFDNWTLTSASNYNWYSNKYMYDGEYQSGPQDVPATPGENLATAIWAGEDTEYAVFSTELRATTNFDGPLNGMLGFYYHDTDRDFGQSVTLGGFSDSTAPDPYTFTSCFKEAGFVGETVSAFGQIIWDIVPDLELAAGLRYIDESNDGHHRHTWIHPNLRGLWVMFDPNDPTTEIIANQNWDDWTPEVTLTWLQRDELTLYAAYKEAYKSGGFSPQGIHAQANPNAVEDFTFQPETAEGVEIGAKLSLLDYQLSLNLAAFSYDYDGLQVDYFNTGVFALSTINAGTVETSGVETDFNYRPDGLPALTVFGALNYLNAEYQEFLAPCWGGQLPSQGCTLTGPLGAPFQNLKGQDPAVAPEWTATLGVDWETPIGNNRMLLGFSAFTKYRSSYDASAFGNPLTEIDSYVTLDASMRLIWGDDRNWEVALIGKNLTDELFAHAQLDGPSTGSGTGTPAAVPSDMFVYASDPWTVQLRLTWRN